MKKGVPVLFLLILTLSLTACSKSSVMDIGAFTDYYNRAAGAELISLEQYSIYEDCFRLVLEGEQDEKLLMSVQINGENKIEGIRLLISKLDDKGAEKTVTPRETEFFAAAFENTLKAYTDLTAEKAKQIVSAMGLGKPSVYSSTGELTRREGDYYIIYYSASTASMLMLYNLNLHPIMPTKKPPSDPVFGNTAIVGRQ